MNITKQIYIQAPPELVWLAWTSSERITEWFAPMAIIEPEVNGKFELYFNPSNLQSMNTQGCTILSYEPVCTLSFQWKGPDPYAEIMNQEGHLTWVEVTFKPYDSGTLVELQHQGWSDSLDAQQAKNWHVQAWEEMLNSLKSRMESGEGILCCS